jgi:hypothetical protein
MISKQISVGFTVLVALALLTVAGAPVYGKGKPNQTCDDVSVNLLLRSASGDSVKDDGGSYPATLNCNNDTNNLYLLTEAGRGIAFQLTNPSDGGAFTLTTDAISANLGASIADSGGILAMGVGTSAATTKLQFNFVVGDKRYFLSWAGADGGSTATVTHPDADAWVIETSEHPGNIARLRECPARGSCKSPVDRFYHAPVRMDLFATQ